MKKFLAILLSLVLVFGLSQSAFAMNFTPSAETKDAPAIVAIVGEDGNEHDGVFHDEEGNEVGYVDPNGILELVITSGSKRGSAPVGEITVMIDVAESEINEAGNVGELAPSMIAELEKLKKNSTDPAVQALDINDFVVANIFDVSLLYNGEIIEQVPEGQTITFCLQTDYGPDDIVYVLVNCDGLGWVLVDSSSIDENGVMTITVSSLCCMAFVVPGYGQIVNGDDAPQSPRTGVSNMNWIFVAGGFCLAAAACVVYKKKVA